MKLQALGKVSQNPKHLKKLARTLTQPFRFSSPGRSIFWCRPFHSLFFSQQCLSHMLLQPPTPAFILYIYIRNSYSNLLEIRKLFQVINKAKHLLWKPRQSRLLTWSNATETQHSDSSSALQGCTVTMPSHFASLFFNIHNPKSPLETK